MVLNASPKTFPATEVRVVSRALASLGESPVWRSPNVFWVDSHEKTVYSSPGEGQRDAKALHRHSQVLGSIVPTDDDRWVLGLQDQIWLSTKDGRESELLAIIHHPSMDHRLNDATADPKGRLLIGSINERRDRNNATLYSLAYGETPRVLRAGLTLSNGIDWSPDGGTIYFTDSVQQTIFCADYTDDGELRNEKVFATDQGEALPDGLTVDAEGFVWSAKWKGHRVVRYDPSGRIDTVLELPVPQPTSVAFGGTDMKTLFITTARVTLDESELADHPLSGSLLAFDTPFRGREASVFKTGK